MVPLFFMVCTLLFIHKSIYFGNDIFETSEHSNKEQLTTADFLNDVKAEFDPNESRKSKPATSKPEEKPLEPDSKKKGKEKEKPPIEKASNLKQCDPYAQPGYFDYQHPLQYNITYISLNPDCQPLDPSPISALEEGRAFPDLQDKTAVLIGDSVDRQNLELLCTHIGGDLTIADQSTHDKEAPGTSGGYPRLCHVKKYNLTISNYFFYGFDQESLWTDKDNVFLEPGDYLKRIDLAESAIKSLKRKVDIAFVNVGLWELARFDRLDHNNKVPECMSLRSEYTKEYQTKLKDFLARIKKVLPGTRLVYRECHYPSFDTGPFFSTADTINRKHKFHTYKIHQINQIARTLTKSASMEYWPIGTHVRDIPDGEFMLDDRKSQILFFYLQFSC